MRGHSKQPRDGIRPGAVLRPPAPAALSSASPDRVVGVRIGAAGEHAGRMTEEYSPLVGGVPGHGAFRGLPGPPPEYGFEARHTPDRGWYVVDTNGSLAHVTDEHGARAALFGDDEQGARACADALNERFGRML